MVYEIKRYLKKTKQNDNRKIIFNYRLNCIKFYMVQTIKFLVKHLDLLDYHLLRMDLLIF